MSGNKRKKKQTLNDILKYEIATDLGLSTKVEDVGWGGLTAAETGKIGGMLSAKKKRLKAQSQGSETETSQMQ